MNEKYGHYFRTEAEATDWYTRYAINHGYLAPVRQPGRNTKPWLVELPAHRALSEPITVQ